MPKAVAIKAAWKKPSKSPAELLTKVKDLLSEKERWTQGAYARNGKGFSFLSENPEHYKGAATFCLLGAIRRVKDGTAEDVIDAACLKLGNAVDSDVGGDQYAASDAIVEFNDADKRKHSQVLKALNKAIKLAEKQA